MLTSLGKISFFMSSYIPVYIILAFSAFIPFLTSNTAPDRLNIICFAVCLLLSIVSAILLAIVIKMSNKSTNPISCNPHNLKINTEPINSYLFVYIIPFILTDITIKNLGILLFSFLLIGYIYIKHDLIYINPILYCVGYNIYQYDDKIIITKKNKESMIDYLLNLECSTETLNLYCSELLHNVYVDAYKKFNDSIE